MFKLHALVAWNGTLCELITLMQLDQKSLITLLCNQFCQIQANASQHEPCSCSCKSRHVVNQWGAQYRETYIKQDPGETPNDRNDRAIRVGTAWYAQRLPQMKIYLLTNDADNRRKALGEQLDAISVQVKLRLQSACTVCCLT